MRIRIQGLAAIAVLVAGAAQGELWMPSVFGDHMVLQQEARIPVWGTAEPGADVTVTIGDESARTKVGADRKWMVRLDDVDVGGPYTMTVKAGSDAKTFNDVLVGEVWVASGQSNMQWDVSLAKNPDKEIAASENPKLRLFYVERKTATSPKPDCNAQWTLATPETVKGFSAVAYFFGRELQQRQGVPVGMIHTSWGGTTCEAWTSRAALEANPKAAPILKRWDDMMANYQTAHAEWEKAHAAWETDRDAAKAAGKEVPEEPRAPVPPDDPNRPANLYNGMIAPLLPYAIKGAIWYQGEGNAGRAYQYRSIFPAMIQNWRKDWGQGDFPFIFVQLANFMERKPEPGESAWAELREAQSMTLSLPNTGMALAIDIGDALDIHPKNKQDVGQRLWYGAERVAYNNRATDRTGPLYKSVTISGNKATIHLENVRRGLKTMDGGPVKGFAVAGPDHKFVWADAQIAGDTIVVSSPQVAKPVAVRYGWADNPEVNVYSGVGLPLSPFRTDDFPGLTISAE